MCDSRFSITALLFREKPRPGILEVKHRGRRLSARPWPSRPWTRPKRRGARACRPRHASGASLLSRNGRPKDFEDRIQGNGVTLSSSVLIAIGIDCSSFKFRHFAYAMVVLGSRTDLYFEWAWGPRPRSSSTSAPRAFSRRFPPFAEEF